jgi:MSHA biogenesis protein MshJ
MRERWRNYAVKIDALPVRERIMVFVAAVAVILFVIDALFIEPAAARRRSLLAQSEQQRTTLSTLRPQIQLLEKKLAEPDALNIARRDDFKRRIAQIDETLKGMQQSLVAAENVKALLQDVLARNPRLQLVSLRTLPVTPLVEKTGKPEATPPVPGGLSTAAEGGAVFKHGVELTIQGSYADLYAYLARLENLSWRMFWARAYLNAEDYPRLTLTITVYTLSLDKAWLVV